ncbi:hypothetical protein CBR_g8955 [Chara braunii]|uniref:Myb/SANT-like DNA-binding domain-containing protein n=1 Tax=Chara braunii TaxID=69332 RepID=A0A388KNC6_CHABU|nr:hypothetical protein CBR_g8955 [Chara braunii]|eukprot:GBG71537.1 hypothetical protein CBR_g8955 [Chara braunii]
MADLYRRLPLLLLVALLLLIVVVFHICFLGRVPGRKQMRRTPKKSSKMDKLQTKTTMSVEGGGSSCQRCNSAEGGRRPYDPTLYRHLSSHEIPSPPSDDDVDDPRSSTVPLGSGSTQDWMGSQLYRHASTPTYIDLLEGRTPAGYDAGLVDLNFGLRFGSGEDLTHTVVVNPASATKHTSPSVRAAGPVDSRGFVLPRRVALSTASVAASRTKTAGLAGCRTTTPGGIIDREGDDDERATTKVVGRQFWDDERQRLRSANTSSIMRGVARINVGAENVFVDCDGGGGEEIAVDDGGDDNEEDDNDEMEIRPVGRKRGGSRATTKVRESCTGRKGKKCAEESSAGDGTKSRDFWTVEHMIALIRAKRDQDLHLAGLGHNYGRMKTKTWKWDDVEKRLVQMGVTGRKVVDCGKKWDNLYQQFKSVHKFMGESGKPNFFTLTPGERRERGFDFRMDERVYSEMKTNLKDTGAPGGVQMPGALGGRNKSGGSDGGGDGQDDDHGSTRHSSLSGGGGGGAGKRKNGRAVVDGQACPWCAARPRTVQKGIPGGIPYRCHSIAKAPKAPSVHGLVVARPVIRFDATIDGFGLCGHPRPPASTSAKRRVIGVLLRPQQRSAASSTSSVGKVPVIELPPLLHSRHPRGGLLDRSTLRSAGLGSAGIHVLLHPHQPSVASSECSFVHSGEAPHHQRRPSARCPSSSSHRSFIRVIHVADCWTDPRYDRRVWAPRASTSSCIHVSQASRHRSAPSSTAAKRRIINVVHRQGKLKRNSGSDDGGESQKGRGHVPKSKRQHFDDESSEHTADFQAEEVSMVDAQGPDVMKRLGIGRDGVSRGQLAALKQGLVGGVAVTLARTPKAAGIVMTDARVARQVPPMVGHGKPRQPLPAQQAGASGVEKTPSAQKVDTTVGGSRTEAADNTTGSGVAEAAEEGRVDDVRRDDGRKDAGGGVMMTTTVRFQRW